MFIGRLRIEEEGCSGGSLVQKVFCQGRDPGENLETGTGLEDEEGDDLLEEKADDDGGPWNVTTVL